MFLYVIERRFDRSLEGTQSLFLFYFFCRSTKKTAFVIKGEYVCCEGWLKILGIKRCMFYKVMRWYNNGYKQVPLETKEIPEIMTGFKTNAARSWMHNYFHTTGEKMPQRNQIHLPSFLNKYGVYSKFKEEMVKLKDAPLSYSRFCRMWRSEFTYVVIPPVSCVLVFIMLAIFSTFLELILLEIFVKIRNKKYGMNSFVTS